MWPGAGTPGSVWGSLQHGKKRRHTSCFRNICKSNECTYKTQRRSLEVDQNCYPKFSISFSLSRRVRTWRKPSWWWPESCWLATALMSNRRETWRATTHLEFSSGPTLGRLTASQEPTRHQRRRHVADSNMDRTGEMKGGWCWKLNVDSGWGGGWRTFHHEHWRRGTGGDPKMHGSGMQLERSQRPQIVALRIFFFFKSSSIQYKRKVFVFFKYWKINSVYFSVIQLVLTRSKKSNQACLLMVAVINFG